MDLLQAFSQRIGEALPAVDELRAAVTECSHAPGTALFRAGEPCLHIFCVQQGIVKLEFVDQHGDARVRDFVAEGGVFAAIECLEQPKAPAWYTASAYGPVTVQRLPYAPVRQLAIQHPVWARCVALYFHDTAMNRGRREHGFLMLSPLDRLRAAVAERPWLLQRVRQQDLASYIGVTPVSLSRPLARERRRQT